MIAIATGFIIEPPTACSTRAATRTSTLGARLHRREASENTATPVTNVRRRPNRSAVEPESMSRLAMTTVRPDRPLQAGEVRAEIRLDGGEGDVDRGDVEPDDEEAQAADEQHTRPAALTER